MACAVILRYCSPFLLSPRFPPDHLALGDHFCEVQKDPNIHAIRDPVICLLPVVAWSRGDSPLSGGFGNGDHCPWKYKYTNSLLLKVHASLVIPPSHFCPYFLPTPYSVLLWTHSSTSHLYCLKVRYSKHLHTNSSAFLQANPSIFRSMLSGKGAVSRIPCVSYRSLLHTSIPIRIIPVSIECLYNSRACC